MSLVTFDKNWDKHVKMARQIIVIRLIIFPTFVAECKTTNTPKTTKPFSFMKFISTLSLSLIFAFLTLNTQAQLFENFEDGSKNYYAPSPIELSTGDWMFAEALIGTGVYDKKNGNKAARIWD